MTLNISWVQHNNAKNMKQNSSPVFLFACSVPSPPLSLDATPPGGLLRAPAPRASVPAASFTKIHVEAPSAGTGPTSGGCTNKQTIIIFPPGTLTTPARTKTQAPVPGPLRSARPISAGFDSTTKHSAYSSRTIRRPVQDLAPPKIDLKYVTARLKGLAYKRVL